MNNNMTTPEAQKIDDNYRIVKELNEINDNLKDIAESLKEMNYLLDLVGGRIHG